MTETLQTIVRAAGDEAFYTELCDWLDAHEPPEGRDGAARREWQAMLADGGWAGIHWPAEFGGRDATLPQQMIYHAVFADRDLPPLIGHRGLTLVGPTLIRHGTPTQQQRWLERIRRAEDLWAGGFSEPEAGSDLASLRTRGEVHGDTISITGQKIWTSNGMESDWIFTLVRTNPDVPKHSGISVVLVPLTAPGITRRPIRRMHGPAEFAEVFFDRVEVPLDHVVGEIDRGWQVSRTTLSHEHFTNFIPSQMRYARQVQRLSRLSTEQREPDGSTRADIPAVREAIGRAWATSQLLLVNGLRNVAKVREGRDPGPEGSILKVFGQEAQRDLYETALTVLGPSAILRRGAEQAPERGRWQAGYLSARAATVGGGTSEIHRDKISEQVLGMPRDHSTEGNPGDNQR